MTTNPDLWKCPHCGGGPRDCRCSRLAFGPGDDYAGKPGPQGGDDSCSFAVFELAAAAIVILALILWPIRAFAQDSASTVYLPVVGAPARTWFTPAELETAQRGQGYDPAVVAPHTWCGLHSTAQPPDEIRYAYCYQNYVNDQPTNGNPAVYYWYSPMLDRVLAFIVTSEASGQ